jgi:hypothetical protein
MKIINDKINKIKNGEVIELEDIISFIKKRIKISYSKHGKDNKIIRNVNNSQINEIIDDFILHFSKLVLNGLIRTNTYKIVLIKDIYRYIFRFHFNNEDDIKFYFNFITIYTKTTDKNTITTSNLKCDLIFNFNNKNGVQILNVKDQNHI